MFCKVRSNFFSRFYHETFGIKFVASDSVINNYNFYKLTQYLRYKISATMNRILSLEVIVFQIFCIGSN